MSASAALATRAKPLVTASLLLGATALQPALAGAGAWTTHGPYGGLVNTVVVDPTTPTTIYAASPVGGVFKSLNSGKTWAAADTGLTSPSVDSLVLEPGNSQMIYAAGSGGIFTTTDGGAHWARVNRELSIKQLTIDPATPTTLYAISQTGPLYVSPKSGRSWRLVSTTLPGSINTFVIDPLNTKNLYAGVLGGLYKSTDAGKTWVLITAGLGSGTPIVGALFIDPKTPSTLYAETGQGLEISTDSGVQWSVLTGAPSVFLGIDPSKTSTLYALDYNSVLFTSTNSGVTWTKIAPLTPSFQGYTRTLVVDPTNSSNLYAGTDEGIFVSNTTGAAWTQDNAGLANTAVTSLAGDARSPGTFYAGTEYSGIFKTTNNGATWTLLYPDWTDKPLSLQVNPKTSTTLYYSSTFSGGVFTSTNGGTTWSNLLPYTDVFALSVNPKNPAYLYAGSGSVPLYLSTNSGVNWKQITKGLTNVSPNSASSSGPNVLLVDPNTGVYYSKNSGTAWSTITPAQTGYYNTGVLYSYAAGKESALVGLEYGSGAVLGYFLDSVAAPTVWTAWATPTGTGEGACAPVNTVVVNPKAPSTFYAGTGCGVLQGTNNGAQMTLMSKGLPANVPVNGIALLPSGKTILAGTYGRGVYAYTVQ